MRIANPSPRMPTSRPRRLVVTDDLPRRGRVIRFPTGFSARDAQIMKEVFAARRTGIRFMPMLHGFLTAIAVAPAAIPRDVWLRAVWGHRGEPRARDLRQIAVLRDPVLRLHAVIERSLDPAIDTFRVDLLDPGASRDPVFEAQVWCTGFYKATLLDAANWRWLEKTSPELIRPIWLFGRDAGLKAMVHATRGYHATAKRWLPRIRPSVLAIRDFWHSRPDTTDARRQG